MGDPLSVAGSIAGLISIGDFVFRKLYHYAKTVKGAEKEIKGLKDEVAALTGVLHNLRLVARDLEADDKFDQTIRIEHVNSCLATLHKINSALSEFQFRKDQTLRNAVHRLKWPFASADTKDLCKEVRRHRETLSLALSADTLVGLLQCLSTQKDIVSHLKSIHATLRRRDEVAYRIAMDDERRKIFKFFSVVDTWPYYEASLSLRHPTTGFWLTEDDVFKRWAQEPGTKLWLTGIPGAGKTILSGLIIEERQKTAGPKDAVVYFYCDYKDSNTQNSLNILSSITTQIAMRDEACFSLLSSYYDQLNTRDQMARSPKASELIDLIHEMVAYLEDVTIIVDGLDECGDESGNVAEMLHDVASAPQNAISMAILSRDEIVIREVLGVPSYHHIEVTAHTEDIEHYVRTEIEERRRRLRTRSEDLKEEIVQKLVSKAQGMYVKRMT